MDSKEIDQSVVDVLVFASANMRSAPFHEWADAFFNEDPVALKHYEELRRQLALSSQEAASNSI